MRILGTLRRNARSIFCFTLMLMLLFRIGDCRYALNALSVVEVIPMVELKKIHGAPPMVAGLFNYQGRIVPVINLNQLLGDISKQAALSTRIILINPDQTGEKQHLLGLLAEQVTETLDSAKAVYAGETANLSEHPYLGGILLQKQEMIQSLQVEKLLSGQEYATILSQAAMSQMETEAIIGE